MKTRLNCEGYEEETALNDSNPASPGKNTGPKAGEVKFNNSNVVQLIGHLHSDLWHQEKLMPACIKLGVQLIRARPPFFIRTGAAGQRATQVHTLPRQSQGALQLYGRESQA